MCPRKKISLVLDQSPGILRSLPTGSLCSRRHLDLGFGSAKAILTQKGSIFIPITLEWILGTLISLLLFSISAYDSREVEDVPHSLYWLFKLDCMDIVWNILSWFSVRRPDYTSAERPSIGVSYSEHPPVSTYRLLVCGTVISFGMSKAMLGYCGHSGAVTWSEWTLAVPITTFLYYLGLYEFNSAHILSAFFSTDQSEVLYSMKTGMTYIIGIFLTSGWTASWAYVLWYITYDPSWDFNFSQKEHFNVTMLARIGISHPLETGLKLFIQECVAAAIMAGAAILFLILRVIARDVSEKSGVVRRAIRVIRRPIVWVVGIAFPSLTDRPFLDFQYRLRRANDPFIRSAHLASRIFLHFALHIFAVIGCLTLGLTSFGFCIRISEVIKEEDIFDRIVSYLAFGFGTFAFLFNALIVARSMVTPFLLWYLESKPLNTSLLIS